MNKVNTAKSWIDTEIPWETQLPLNKYEATDL